MTTLRNLFLLLIIAGTFGYSGFKLLRPCASPIEYSIGTIDPRFKMTEADFLKEVQEAEGYWEKAVGKELFEYKPHGKLDINFIYDVRQATADKNKAIESKIDDTQESADEVKERFESLKFRYETESKKYDAMLDQYKADLDSYNVRVSSWNSKGGASHDEYSKMTKEKSALESAQSALEAQRLKVNDLAKQVNALIGAYNALVKDINSNIKVINQSADQEFEQGEYVSEGFDYRIDIYEFNERKDLVRVLMHELGHALGVDHNENPDSIMYHLNQGEGFELSPEDVRDLKAVCRF